jgi:vitamin B12 transporter
MNYFMPHFVKLAFAGVFASVLQVSALNRPSPEAVSAFSGSDSISAYRIGEVTVLAADKTSANTAVSPFQVMDRKNLQSLSAEMVGDAAKFFSGVLVKDYGGMGGMKTLSVRSMGAQHTAVSYDGIVLTDCQTGQTDLSRYSIENVDLISLSIGDGNSIFQPARVFASSGVLTIRTRRPIFEGTEKLNGTLGFKYGSFGQKEINAFGAYKLSENWSLSLSALSQQSKGDYDYRLYDGDGANDFDIVPRSNNAVKNLHLESTLFGRFAGERLLEVKAYYYNSDRGLPGAVILYNTASSQHLWDKSAFVQAHYEQPLGKKAALQVNGKLNQTRQHYLNPDYLGSSGAEDYSYRQEEAYLSAALLYKPLPGLSFAWASDGAVAGMTCNLKDFSDPTRYSLLSNLSGKYVNDWLLATASILATGIRETTVTGPSAKSIGRLSPAMNVSVQPIHSFENLRLRAFWKSSFREPSFNDLYYSAIGNTALKPENSEQTDVGLTFTLPWKAQQFGFQCSADAFSNRITDKIMAVPTRNMFIWSMVNLGKVNITGVDLNLEATKKWSKKTELLAAWTHSYQRALDMTDPTSKTYNQQIAYAPRIYGSGRVQLSISELKLGYSLLYSGHRYVIGQNINANNLPGYVDQSIMAEYVLPRAFGEVVIRGELQNLANENYEIVRNFPMPGRTFRVSVRFEF